MNYNKLNSSFTAIIKLKHKCILELAYSSGLQIGEVLILKITDSDSIRMFIRVEQGKGRKDRHPILSNSSLIKLRSYYKEYKPNKQYKPKYFLFEGYNKQAYTSSSVQKILKRAAFKASIQKE